MLYSLHQRVQGGTERTLTDARQLKCLTVVDEFTRQGLTIQVARNMTGADVVTVLELLFAEHGKPVCIRSDNGTELVSHAVQKWLSKKHVDTHYIDPGRTLIARVSTQSSGRRVWIGVCLCR